MAEVELRFKYEQVRGPLVGPSTMGGCLEVGYVPQKKRLQKYGENDDKPPICRQLFWRIHRFSMAWIISHIFQRNNWACLSRSPQFHLLRLVPPLWSISCGWYTMAYYATCNFLAESPHIASTSLENLFLLMSLQSILPKIWVFFIFFHFPDHSSHFRWHLGILRSQKIFAPFQPVGKTYSPHVMPSQLDPRTVFLQEHLQETGRPTDINWSNP